MDLKNMGEKYGRLLKSNTLYSSTESNSDGTSSGLRTRAKVEVATGRRVKRDSCFNRNRFDIDLYDELEETLNSGQPLKRLIKADEATTRNEAIQEEPVDETPEPPAPHTHKSVVATRQTAAVQDSTFTLAANSSTGGAGACNLSRANTIATSNRKKLLEEWRRQRENKEAKEHNGRPIFKVYHVDQKELSKPPIPPAHVQTHAAPSSSFTFKVWRIKKNRFFS